MPRQFPEYDFVIVGAGAAGCVLASRLSEDRHVRVCLLEAGPSKPRWISRVPALSFLGSQFQELTWGYTTPPQPHLGGQTQNWIQGKVLGGGTAINGLVYSRGHSSEYDRWQEQFGCAGWDFASVLPYFKRSESNHRGANRWHGDAGPLRVAPSKLDSPITEIFISAGISAGFRNVDDLNADIREGFGINDLTIGGGERCSAATSYLASAASRPNLTVIANAHALGVQIDDDEARGVDYLCDGAVARVMASREVILSSGVVNSPKLLMLSGIGPADHLRSLGIPVKADSPNVGRNLQNHIAFGMEFAIRKPLSLLSQLTPLTMAGQAVRYAVSRRGFFANGNFPISGFLQVAGGDVSRGIKFAMIGGLVGEGAGLLGSRPSRHGFTLQLYEGTPASRGRIDLVSGDPLASPVIEPNYFSNPSDVVALADAVEQLKGILTRPGLRELMEDEPADEICRASRTGLAALVKRRSRAVYHGVGTCAMGSDSNAVIDPELRVRGVENLRVVDGSIIPLNLNSNPAAPIMMIAEKASDLIRGRDTASLPASGERRSPMLRPPETGDRLPMPVAAPPCGAACSQARRAPA
jgi:choline dehydrogenase